MPSFDLKTIFEGEKMESESIKDQLKGFVKAWGEIVIELSKGCKDVVLQTMLTDDSFLVKKVKKVKGPVKRGIGKLSVLNEFLPEGRDPVHAWLIILSVFFIAISGIPGIRLSLLEEFGVRLVTYDLPGFGESDPHPNRTLQTSALDLLHLAESVNIGNKFWVLGYSSSAMHAWAALKYIPGKIAGAAMFAPMVNPYDPGMTKEEKLGTWEQWTRRRRFMFLLARRFPRYLRFFYRRTFLSGKHGPIDKWLSWSLAEKDKAVTENPVLKEFWQRDVEESIRQSNVKPFVEEATLQVLNWPFSLKDLQVQKKCPQKGFFDWFHFMSSEAECELVGFLEPIHIWQGMDDLVVPTSITDYVARVLPSAVVHKLPDDGHFSYFYFCDECHRTILLTLFGEPQGPIGIDDQPPLENDVEEEGQSRSSPN